MKLIRMVFLGVFAPCCIGSAQDQGAPPPLPALPEIREDAFSAPPEVVASAVKAVEALGKEVVMGRYHATIERMNPLWKERTAKRLGSMEELEKQLSGVAARMVQQGISIIAFNPQGQPRSYEVWPGKKLETVDGVQVERLIYTKWLVLVPTVTRIRIIAEGEPKPVVIESTGFQVAVSDKGANDWTFIDGSGTSVSDLRRLFINLPADLQLPPLERRELR